jgi:hypothetical protein
LFVSSGPLRDAVEVRERYKYSVYDAQGNRTDDPDVDIE